MRRLLSAALLLFTVCSVSGAELTCVWRGDGPNYTEWSEGSELWGARIVLADPR